MREKLVQAAQQPGAERRSESAMGWAGVPRDAEYLLAFWRISGRCTPCRLARRLAGKGAPGAKEGVNHLAEQKRAGPEGAGPGGCRPGSPFAPPAKGTPRWVRSPLGAPPPGAPAFEAWHFGVPCAVMAGPFALSE